MNEIETPLTVISREVEGVSIVVEKPSIISWLLQYRSIVTVRLGSETLLFSNLYIPPNATAEQYETHSSDREKIMVQFSFAEIMLRTLCELGDR